MEGARPGERDVATTMLQTVLASGYALGAAVAGLGVNMAGFAPTLGAEGIVHPVTRAIAVGVCICVLAILAGFGVRLKPKAESSPATPGR